MTHAIRERLQTLREEVDAVARSVGRGADEIAILGVSKKQSADAIREAVAAGLNDIGENYVQEARKKFALLEDAEPFVKHFIGHVQTNKAKQIAETFDLVQGVDRIEAGAALAKAAESLGKRLDVLVQVNISPSERFGCAPATAPALAEALRESPNLSVRGVMAIGPVTDDRDQIRRAFALAAKTFEQIGGNTLSIGMSGDWREAIAAGSTMIRIGTALFGPRPVPATPA
ncbi:MAG: YggS family pyridoxal phosphate-dependent enzyme [Candidatus Eremiobacteraeota bacterium]|nr:YggS family pyridoxal phosphate-dependent enzyme [Candidatus Eremiobacteraeota bacterium]